MEVDWNSFANASNIAILILTFLALYVASQSLKAQKKNERIEEFKQTVNAQNKDRAKFVRWSYDYHHNELQKKYIEEFGEKEGKEKINHCDPYVLTEEGWILDQPIPLKDVIAKKEGEYKPNEIKANSTSRSLPYPKNGYSSNIQIATNKYLFADPSYAMVNKPFFEKDGKLTIPIVKGKYTDFIDSCDILSYEISRSGSINNFDYDNNPKEKVFEKYFPLRKITKPFELYNRFAGIGVCTLTIFTDFKLDYNTYFIIHKRSDKIAEGSNSFHVVPAGSMQPINWDHTDDNVIEPLDTVIKEFAEELLDEKGYGDLASEELLNKFRRELYADCLYLGVGLEPLNLKTEMLVCLIVDVSKSPILQHCKNGEQLRSFLSTNYEGDLIFIPFEKMYVDQYKDTYHTIPACRSILNIVAGDQEKINRYSKWVVQNNIQ